MKRMKIILRLLWGVAIAASAYACQDDTGDLRHGVFLMKDSDRLTFGYQASSQTFLICANAPWSVYSDDSWLAITPTEGVGDGATWQEIHVSAGRNAGDERQDKITIVADNKTLSIAVVQHKIVAFEEPAVLGTLVSETEFEGVVLSVPYRNALGSETFTVSVAVSGAAAAGILPVVDYPVALTGVQGAFEIPLAGSPSTYGAVAFTVTSSFPGAPSTVVHATIARKPGIVFGAPTLSSPIIATKDVSGITLNIPYSNAVAGEQFLLSADVAGADAIDDIRSRQITILGAPDGVIAIPLTGIAYTPGPLAVTFTVSYTHTTIAPLTTAVVSDGKRYFPGAVLVTGVMTDPRGSDCNTSMTVSWYNPNENANLHGDGYEYIQLMAVKAINFAVTPYSVIVSRNTSTQTPTGKAWIEGGSRTYKFNLTQGSVARGEFFYIGGMAKALNGYSSNATNTTASSFDGSVQGKVWTGHPIEIPAWAPQNAGATQTTGGITSIRDAKWIRTKSYISEAGDDEVGNATTTNNSNLLSNSPNPSAYPGTFGVDGIAVYQGTEVDEHTMPIDVVFFGENAEGAANYSANSIGYTVPLNDLYSPVNLTTGEAQPYFGQGSNSGFLRGGQPELTMGLPCSLASGKANGRDCSTFIKFAGELDTDNSWIQPREVRTVYLLEPKNWLEQYGLARTARLSDIESALPEAGADAPVMIVR
ncbi:MAG: BACON domain-containing protein [Prevotellaceae bacterium]|jgi:hypothetical protein|nr:BACON domain-containing protein [Prevotellaceae bacterium]